MKPDNPVSVIVPIKLWRQIESERETAYLLRSAKMKERLLQAKSREEGIPFEEALEKLGIRPWRLRRLGVVDRSVPETNPAYRQNDPGSIA